MHAILATTTADKVVSFVVIIVTPLAFSVWRRNHRDRRDRRDRR
jgi:hypothetical protein